MNNEPTFDEVKEAKWIAHYECSNCGEFSTTKKEECPFCHAKMTNREHVIQLCRWRNEDRCNCYCDGYDEACDYYEGIEVKH